MKQIFFAIGFCVLTACADTTGPAQVASAPASLTGDFGTDLNTFRAGQGRGPVQQNPKLRRAAQRHAEDMTTRGYFSHRSPGGPNGDNMSARLAAGGCRAGASAENIAQGQTSEAAVLAAWQNSTGHRRNMLGANYTEYGLGRSGNTWVLLFSSGC